MKKTLQKIEAKITTLTMNSIQKLKETDGGVLEYVIVGIIGVVIGALVLTGFKLIIGNENSGFIKKIVDMVSAFGA